MQRQESLEGIGKGSQVVGDIAALGGRLGHLVELVVGSLVRPHLVELVVGSLVLPHLLDYQPLVFPVEVVLGCG